MMKRVLITILPVAAVLLLFASCFNNKEDDGRLTVSSGEVAGLWVKSSNPYEYWRFRDDMTGITWDETPDPETGEPEMTEELSNLGFSWSIDGDVLSFDFPGAMENQDVPKYYYITEISASSMKWRDEYGLTYTMRKVNRK